jgi:hypothetical protein
VNFLEFERRWIVAIMSGFLSPDGELTVREGEVDHLATAEVMAEGSNAKAALGLHAAVWLLALAPVWMLGRAQTLDELPAAMRTEVLSNALSHRTYLVRGLATLLKLATTLAMMRSPAVRARTHYDQVPSPPVRRALPLAAGNG